MAIRHARSADLDEIASLIRELADYEHLTHEAVFDDAELGRHLFGDAPAARVTIAEAGEPPAVAGFALWFPTFSTFLGEPGIWLEDLYVRPQHRGQGLGLALLEHLRARTRGRLEWAVLDWNEPAIAFYDRLGAAPVDGWTRYRWYQPPA
jgi:GNAT superfamily N-acetyltransferase